MGLSGLRCGITSAALISKDRLDGAAGGILNCLGYKPNLSPVADVGDDDVPLARLSEESRVRLPIMVALGSAERPMACLGTMHRSLANVSDQPAAGQR